MDSRTKNICIVTADSLEKLATSYFFFEMLTHMTDAEIKETEVLEEIRIPLKDFRNYIFDESIKVFGKTLLDGHAPDEIIKKNIRGLKSKPEELENIVKEFSKRLSIKGTDLIINEFYPDENLMVHLDLDY
ncbi:MAG: hypothetical protein GOU97_01600 [Nanoarchaeota archaeon]|nr:hypothetical protein [Nanoarchaeota archaeon]